MGPNYRMENQGRLPTSRSEQKEPSLLNVGEKIQIGDNEFEIQHVSYAHEVRIEFGLRIRKDIPIYWLNGVGPSARGAYVPAKDIILFFTNTDKETQEHELTHAVEFFQEKRPGLVALYEETKSRISENSFDGGFISLNFRKDIHQFIADGRTKPAFIQALKKEDLYERFQMETAYLFEERV